MSFRSLAFLVFTVTTVLAAYAPDRIVTLPTVATLPSATYSGYIPLTGNRKAFYWFAESQGTPSKDPLVVWFNGGPGCTSLEGNFAELGAITMGLDGAMRINPYSWNKISNSLFIESPPGVGFSKDTPGSPTPYTDELTAQLNYETLTTWLKTKFPEFMGSDLYLTGESYAGRYVPQLAKQILNGDAEIKAMMRGFMLGNPCMGLGGNPDPTLDPYLQYHGFKPLDKSIPSNGSRANYDAYDILVNTCANQKLAKFVKFPHPVVDAFKKRFGDVPPVDPCSDAALSTFLNRKDVQTAIHADPTSWVECGGVNYKFNSSSVTDLYQAFMNLTDWHILVYSGVADTVINFAQTETIIISLGRPRVSGWEPWNYMSAADGMQLGGFYVLFDRISFATVNGAGHMVPEYQPAPALELFTSFLTTGKPGRK